MTKREGTTLRGPTKDSLTFARSTWLLLVLFGLIGIATTNYASELRAGQAP